MRDSTWVVLDFGDTWVAQPMDGGSSVDLNTIGVYVISLGIVDGSSIIDDAPIGASLIGDIL